MCDIKNDFWRKKLIELREKANLKQEELAKKIGISQSHISHLEGGNRDFTQKVLDKILEYYGLDYADIFCGSIFTKTGQIQRIKDMENDKKLLEKDIQSLKKEIDSLKKDEKRLEKLNEFLEADNNRLKTIIASYEKILTFCQPPDGVEERRLCRMQYDKFFKETDLL